ncbi:MAG TPA: hypothetical protein VGK67_40240 [Myxococcales bacterium]|jgi:hypothetical protein
MNSRKLVVLLALLVAGLPAPAHAGLLGGLAKLGKLGKVAKVGKAARLAKLGKVAKVGKAAAGMSAVVAAERAAPLFAGLGEDAARGATFLARGADGELLRVTKAAGAEKVSAEALGGLGAAGERPSVFLDLSAADAAPALAIEHPNASLALVDGEKRLSLLQKAGGEVGDLVVDTASGLVDLEDYLGGDDRYFFEKYALHLGLGVGVVVATIWWLKKRRGTAFAA